MFMDVYLQINLTNEHAYQLYQVSTYSVFQPSQLLCLTDKKSFMKLSIVLCITSIFNNSWLVPF